MGTGTFSIPITKDPQPDGPNVYHIPTNDHDGRPSTPQKNKHTI